MVRAPASPKARRPSHRFKNPLDDIGASRWSLRFANRQTEAAFAEGLSAELARDIALCAVLVISVDAAYLALFTSDLPDVYSSASVNAFPVLMLIHSSVIFVCMVIVAVATAQMRCKLLSPWSLEVFFVCCSTVCLMMIPFAEQALLFKLLGDMEEAKRTESNALGVGYLLVDCVITVTSLLPLRWSSTWPVYLLASCWCAAVRLFVVGTLEGHSHAIATQVLLTVLGASGSRTLERTVRRLFFTVTMERTKRARTEFLLAQQEPQEEPRAPSTAQQSLDTGAIFGGTSGLVVDLESTLRLVEGVAEREQWLIGPQDIRVHPRRVLGRGSFGAVVAGTMSGLPVAVKLPLGRVHAEALTDSASLISELRVFRKLRHPNIAMFIGAVIDPSLRELAVVMEVVIGPDLHDFVKSPSKVGGERSDGSIGPDPHDLVQSPSKERCDRSMYSLVCGLARALQYLHSHRPCIVHGDLKPKNVLVSGADSGAPCAKLVDFGLSRILAGRVRPLGGTLRWSPPEQLGGVPHRSVDVFAFGLIASFVVTGSQPFDGWSREAMLRSLRRRRVWKPTPPEGASACAQGLLETTRDCSRSSAADRPTMSSVCENLAALAGGPHLQELLGDLKERLWHGCCHARGAVELAEPDSESWEHAVLWLRSHLRPKAEPARDPLPQAAAETASQLGHHRQLRERELEATSTAMTPEVPASSTTDLRSLDTKATAGGRRCCEQMATGGTAPRSSDAPLVSL